MARKHRDDHREASMAPRSKGKSHVIVAPDGSRYPFLRGMVTHDLIRRGLDFDRAYATADALRNELRGRGEISSDKLEELINRQVEALYGPEAVAGLSESRHSPPELLIVRQGQTQPFSRGILARSILAAGVEFEHAYRVVLQLQEQLLDEGVTRLPSEEIVRRVARLLEEYEGRSAANNYRLVRQIPSLPKPLIVYLGGASGTGKSTLGFELAPLLRIYRMNSTDTVRQVMRMVFSPAILPSLHSSSFEMPRSPLPRAGDDATSAHASITGTSFEEQSRRVVVGVRAIVERAIQENMSLIVEGVHLFPPLVPFPDLEGAAYQIPLVLGTRDPEAHRSRFLSRARVSGRRAERYVENFESIRVIHDWILEQAEAHDVPMLDTSDPVPPVSRALKVVVLQLQRKVPTLATDAFAQLDSRSPVLLLILDGVADRPVRALGGRTPLQAAVTPTLDTLAREGSTGLADPVAPGVVPDTAAGTLALLGQSPLALERGPVEALGAGIRLRPEDVALRGNLATVDDEGNVIDRRAGRIRDENEELANALDRLPLPGTLAGMVEIRVRAATEHRLAVVLRGEGLSTQIQGSDPGEGAVGPPLTPRPVDPKDQRAVHTARVLALFERQAHSILSRHPLNRKRIENGEPAANVVLTRGPGRIHRLAPLEDSGLPLHISCIAGDQTILGLARWLGAETLTTPEMTANLDTDLVAKFSLARDSLRRSDLVILHLKGADIAAHDQRPDLKVRFLEQVDLQLARLLAEHDGPLRVAVGSDHATLSESGQHGADPLPVLIWERGSQGDGVETFDEQSVASGSLRRFPLQMLLGKLFDLE